MRMIRAHWLLVYGFVTFVVVATVAAAILVRL
jgi:hypothetical protein